MGPPLPRSVALSPLRSESFHLHSALLRFQFALPHRSSPEIVLIPRRPTHPISHVPAIIRLFGSIPLQLYCSSEVLRLRLPRGSLRWSAYSVPSQFLRCVP